jgi:beta-xylosidase
LYGTNWAPALVYAQIRFWKYNDLEMIDVLKTKVSKALNELDEVASTPHETIKMSDLNEASNNLSILLSALNTQRFYASGMLSEIN